MEYYEYAYALDGNWYQLRGKVDINGDFVEAVPIVEGLPAENRPVRLNPRLIVKFEKAVSWRNQ